MDIKSAMARPNKTPLAQVLLRPFHEFVETNTSSGILLILCTLIALVWANSPWSEAYHALWEQHFLLGFTGYSLDLPLHLWINDGLMAIFFLLVGMEIKREVLVGELSQIRQAVLPMMAAFGGVLLPALIYAAFNWNQPSARGWGVPMATDIAFALGVLALLGSRIPLPLKIFLAALAIVDDLFAVITIALFYSTGINILALSISGVVLIILLLCNLAGVRRPIVYALLGFLLWLAMFQSGIHATIAGVLLAMTIPARSRIDANTFVNDSRELLDTFAQSNGTGVGLVMDDNQQSAVQTLETRAEQVQAPLQRIEHALHVPVTFLIIPIFVLANAGVTLNAEIFTLALTSPITIGILIGLVVGKQLGIILFTWLPVKMGWAHLPEGVSWKHIYGVGWLAGIGFTMSLFISDLAFTEPHAEYKELAKVGILLALLIAGCGGYLLLMITSGRNGTKSAIDEQEARA